NCMVFPVLASLTRDYLGLAAGSAIVEQTFSVAEDICLSEKVCLVPQTMEYNVGSRLLIWKG
ncbi:hypothetical protein DFH28DRAFT_876151, partial [Melampsora americana]